MAHIPLDCKNRTLSHANGLACLFKTQISRELLFVDRIDTGDRCCDSINSALRCQVFSNAVEIGI